ncbi:MAG: 6-phosphogluconolactonase [Acidobacteria bacterium]|nr:MAG: 6-phosphogluconolactonase [Acidobacteriota bacterium]
MLPREVLPGVYACADAAELARVAARRFVDWAWQSIAKDGNFSVALSGGSTPRDLYRLLASPEFRAQVDWPRLHLFWGDERAVPPESSESNYGMARRELLLRVPIPPSNVHRMEAEDPNIGRAAHNYEATLRQFLPLDDRGFPRFHLILLGLGPDGHTASLFPGSKLLRETSRWVSTPLVPKLGTRRMTLTLPVLEAARRVVFLVAGAEKAFILHEVLCERRDPPLPAQMVKPREGERLFLVDEAAAVKISSSQSRPIREGKS